MSHTTQRFTFTRRNCTRQLNNTTNERENDCQCLRLRGFEIVFSKPQGQLSSQYTRLSIRGAQELKTAGHGLTAGNGLFII